jgi:hypothetical protein
MKGVIIIDEQQLVIENATDIITSVGADKFTVRISTATNEYHDGLTEEQLLESILTEAPGNLPPITTESASVARGPAVVGSAPRVVVEPPTKAEGRSTFSSSVMGMKPQTVNSPSQKGILTEDAAPVKVGQRFSLNPEQLHELSEVRRALELKVVHKPDVAKEQYPLIKDKYLVQVKSAAFAALFGEVFKVGAMTLVIEEQGITRGHDRENLLLVESGPEVVIDALGEQPGTGTFHLEEVVSVYENPETYRTKVDNGKDQP